MLHFKCPTCKKFFPVADEKAGKDSTCPDCGSKLVLLKPVEGSTLLKAKDVSETTPEPGAKNNRRPTDEEALPLRMEDPPPKPKAGKMLNPELDEDVEIEIKPKKKRGKSKTKREDDGEDDLPQKMYSDNEGENVLGPCKEVFRPGIDTLRIVAIACCVLAAVGLLSCILSTFTKMPDAAIPFALIAFVGGMGGFLWSMKFLTFKVAVHAGGIVHSQKAQTRIIPWEEITSVLHATEERKGSTETINVYTLELTDLSKIVYSDTTIKDAERLGNVIIEKTSILIVPKVRVKYDRGEMFDFGRLGINHVGLHYKKQVLKWEEIQGVKITDGYLAVCRQGKWVRWHDVKASSIPNLHVFLTFANEAVAKNAS